jgi:hypothetical protein
MLYFFYFKGNIGEKVYGLKNKALTEKIPKY